VDLGVQLAGASGAGRSRGPCSALLELNYVFDSLYQAGEYVSIFIQVRVIFFSEYFFLSKFY